MISRRLKIVGLLLPSLVALSVGVQGEIKGTRAREVEAAFLLQFSKYVKWPDSAFSGPDSPMIVGILGRDPFGSYVDELARTTKVGGRSIEVRRFDTITSSVASHILFVGPQKAGHMDEIVEATAGRPVLLVGESENFLEFGHITFAMIDNKIRFYISKTNSDKHRLRISSKLLKVAIRVE